MNLVGFPTHRTGYTVSKNPHKRMKPAMTTEEFIERQLIESDRNEKEDYFKACGQFQDPKDLDLALENDEVWTLSWDHKTKQGNVMVFEISASSLPKLLSFAKWSSGSVWEDDPEYDPEFEKWCEENPDEDDAS